MQRINFKRLQRVYPDAIKATINRKNGVAPFSESVLATMAGGGKVLAFRSSKNSQTIVCSKQAERDETEDLPF